MEFAEDWPLEGIDRVLTFLPAFESEGFQSCSWFAETAKAKGERVQLPYPTYSNTVEAFWSAFAETGGWIDPYGPLPEDPAGELERTKAVVATYPIDYLQSASINQIRRYLCKCRRGERFCDGHIDDEFRQGKIVAALRRLQELRKA